jgi:hypothetical protein
MPPATAGSGQALIVEGAGNLAERALLLTSAPQLTYPLDCLVAYLAWSAKLHPLCGLLGKSFRCAQRDHLALPLGNAGQDVRD